MYTLRKKKKKTQLTKLTIRFHSLGTHLGTCCTVQLHNILEGRALYKTASLMNIDRVSCKISRSHEGLINLECEVRNTFINI